MGRSNFLRRLFVVAALSMLTSCSYVKYVYKVQSKVAYDIADKADTAEKKDDEKQLALLYNAEDSLRGECSALRLAGNEKFWSGRVNLFVFIAALLSGESCELKAREIDANVLHKLPTMTSPQQAYANDD